MRRAAAEDSSCVIAREGVLEIRGDHERFEFFVGELLGKKVGEAVAEFLAQEVAGSALKFPANEIEAVRVGAAEPLPGQWQPLVGMLGNRKNPPPENKLIRP